MELSSHEDQEDEIPMPISAFVGVHGHHSHVHHGHIHHHGHMNHLQQHHYHKHDPSSSSSHNMHNIIPLNNSNGTSNTTTTTIVEEDDQNQLQCNINDHNDGKNDDMGAKKKMIKYKECQKNHAASMGGNATDGCGEFMPSGEEGSLESLTCAVCNCHRNFHRKEIQGEQMMIISPTTHNSHFYPSIPHPHLLNTRGRKVILGSGVPFSRSLAINMPYDHQSDDHHHHHGNAGGMMMVRPYHDHHHHDHHNNQVVKKRFRTKFSQEQKEKMLEFAEKVGWKIQKQEESVVQQFCQQIGVKRRVLKVWMHNNKHNLAKKNNVIDDIINNNNNS